MEAFVERARERHNELRIDVPTQVTLPPGSRAAVYTWHGVYLEVSGGIAHEYAAQTATMQDYFHVADILEQKRLRAEERGDSAPRVLVTGAASSGKTALCQLLCNYAIRKAPCAGFRE